MLLNIRDRASDRYHAVFMDIPKLSTKIYIAMNLGVVPSSSWLQVNAIYEVLY